MDVFPELRTDRLILTRLLHADVPKIVEYAGNPNVAATTLNIPHPYSEADAIFWINRSNQGFIEQTQYTFGIRLRSGRALIGGIGLIAKNRFDRAALGYWIAEPFWNEGYATEAVGSVLAFGFDVLGLNKIYATHLVENPASGKVMIKNGMIKEGELKDHTKKDGRYRSLVQYRLTRREFDQRD